MDDGLWSPTASEEGKAIGIDLGLLDFAVTSNGSKYQNPRHLKKHERNLKRKQRQLSRIPKMDLSVREFDCPDCQSRHDRDINAAIDIRNQGLRIWALGTSVTALRGNVRPKHYGRKSTAAEVVALELGSPHHNA
jgi:transposase